MTVWNGCYDDRWKGLICDEAFAHPAKYAQGLIERIADYLDLPRGSVVVDPFGGVGLGGIVFASRGVQWYGCELESKFVELAKQNFAIHAATWAGFNDPMPVIVQGDSRKLRENLSGMLADCVVRSPPFLDGLAGSAEFDRKRANQPDSARYGRKSFNGTEADYGATPGQLGNMPAGKVDAVVSSSPYANSLTGDNTASETAAESTAKRTTPGGSLGQSQRHQGYGGDGNLGNEDDTTFWAAAREIVAECYAILKPGGLAVWVCKDFIRKGQRVPFSDDWERLCVSCGLEPVERIQAMLVAEDRHPSLFGGEEVKTKERKSFFRRLAEKKGSPPIDHEDVIVLRKPATPRAEVSASADSGADAVVGSPPFVESLNSGESADDMKARWKDAKLGGNWGQQYADNTPGQLGMMKPGTPPSEEIRELEREPLDIAESEIRTNDA